MKLHLVGIGVAACVLSVAFAQTSSHPALASPSQTLADVRLAIDRGNAQWSEGWKKGDPAMVAAIFTPDGVQLSSSGKVIKGHRAILERQRAAMLGSDPGVVVTVTTVNVWLDGSTAYETGKYKYEYTEKGTPKVDEGRYVTVWKHQKDGAWKLAMDMGVPQE
jgi:uncharacterized protein (TIGR02246 family)